MNKNQITIFCDKAIEICIYAFIFFLPFAKAAAETFIYLAIALFIVKRFLVINLSKEKRLIQYTELNQALGIFLMVNALTIIISIDPNLSLMAFLGKVLKFVTLYYIVVETINDRERLRRVALIMLISILLVIADAGVQYFRGVDFLRGYSFARLSASFRSANAFGGWLITLIPIFLGLIISRKQRGLNGALKKTVLGVLVLFMLVCLVLTYSRGAWLGFAMGLALFFYYIIRQSNFKFKIAVSLLTVLSCVALVLINPALINKKIKSIGNINLNLNRESFWRESIHIIEDFPVLGTGLNTYSVVAPHYKIAEGGGIYPHNSYLQMAAETGIVGLVSFIWILLGLFRAGLRTLSKRRDTLLLGLLSGILAFLVQAFFDTHLYSLQLVVLLWFMMGLTMAVIRLEPDV